MGSMTSNPIKVLLITPTERDVRRLQGVVSVPGASHVELTHVLDVALAIAKGRQRDAEDVEPVVQVLAELEARDRIVQ